MGGIKTEHSYELNEDAINWLKQMAVHYDLPDAGKALRIVLDYVMHGDVDLDEVFEEIRCNHCV